MVELKYNELEKLTFVVRWYEKILYFYLDLLFDVKEWKLCNFTSLSSMLWSNCVSRWKIDVTHQSYQLWQKNLGVLSIHLFKRISSLILSRYLEVDKNLMTESYVHNPVGTRLLYEVVFSSLRHRRISMKLQSRCDVKDWSKITNKFRRNCNVAATS